MIGSKPYVIAVHCKIANLQTTPADYSDCSCNKGFSSHSPATAQCYPFYIGIIPQNVSFESRTDEFSAMEKGTFISKVRPFVMEKGGFREQNSPDFWQIG
jgi:hypothetical protein